jgi:integrase
MSFKYETRTAKDGTVSYTTRVSLGFDGNGERIRERVTCGSVEELKIEVARLTLAKASGTVAVRNTTTLAAYLRDEWLPYYEDYVAKGTYAVAKTTVETSISPARLGGLSLAAVTNAEVAKWYRWLKEERGLTAATVKRRKSVLSAAMETAREWGYVAVNVVRTTKSPPVIAKEPRYLSVAETVAFVEAAQAQGVYEPLFTLAVATGARPAELTALQWSDFDVEKKTVTIRRAWSEPDTKRRELKETKTKKPRTLKLDESVLDYVFSFKTAQNARKLRSGGRWNPDGFIAVSRDGKAILVSNFRRKMIEIIDDLGFDHATPKALRHTNATLLLRAGTNSLRTVQQRLGHARGTTTLNVYAHVLDGEDEEAAASLPALAPVNFRRKKDAETAEEAR